MAASPEPGNGGNQAGIEEPLGIEQIAASLAPGAEGSAGTAEVEPTKRGRGRPRKERSEGETQTERKTSKKTLDLSGVEQILLTISATLVAMTKVPECELSQPEAKALADAIAKVARHYPVSGASAKAIDWTQLAICLATIGGCRVMAYKARTSRERQVIEPDLFSIAK